jgi:pyruvate-ferredoxin/flavodoxin oxidoreductase
MTNSTLASTDQTKGVPTADGQGKASSPDSGPGVTTTDTPQGVATTDTPQGVATTDTPQGVATTDTRQGVATLDGNEAVAAVAYRASEVIAIYPITPSSTMGELADAWASENAPNLWGAVPDVLEMQSEGGAAGAVHGAVQAGALATTFTSSQGLLLMIPNLYKIAGELTPFCLHVAARALATHALSIFGDHSDVMACRQIGLGMLGSASVQEAQDFAAISHSVTLVSRIPFLHFFDGFRTSHEVTKIRTLSDEDLRSLLDDEAIAAHRARSLSPDHPVLRGTAQNPDAFFQAREAANGYYSEAPRLVEEAMARFAALTGRHYGLFDYAGHPEAERIVIAMGSGAETVHETVDALVARGEKVGVLKVRLFRPFSIAHFAGVLPASVRAIAVLDRCKEPGAVGEPLYQDVITALAEARTSGLTAFATEPIVVGGRFGLGSKEFTPAMVKAVLDNLAAAAPRNHFTVGIRDDVTGFSLDYDPTFEVEGDDVYRAVFFGLGSDGTVGANKNTLKIVGEHTERSVQGYFVYDSKKSGSTTVSHLRFGTRPIRSAYLVARANFVACHSFGLLDKQDVIESAAEGATVLLNAPLPPDQVWDALPREVQEIAIERKVRLFSIDAYRLAREAGLGPRTNTIMQACFFALTDLLPKEEALAEIKGAIEHSYGKRGEEVVRRNIAAVDTALANLHEIPLPVAADSSRGRPPIVSERAPDFVKNVSAVLLAGRGDLLPVSAFPVDGTWPTGTAKWEKRAIAQSIPVWDPAICIQCNLCAFVCPHSAIRVTACDDAALAGAPEGFLTAPSRSKELEGLQYVLHVAPEDCTGCDLCVNVCPAKDKTNPRHKAIDMAPLAPIREREAVGYEFFLGLPEPGRDRLRKVDVRTSQYFEPLFEYSGACSGCGETPYLKLLTQLFGDRLMIANATGCSSIYGGNLPTTPYTVDRDGRGPTWSNSLFEDNAEFGLGMRLGVEAQAMQARRLLAKLAPAIGEDLAARVLAAAEAEREVIGHPEGAPGEALVHTGALASLRTDIEVLRTRLAAVPGAEAALLLTLADYLAPKSVWLVGGDGWAYDIGYGGLDHVLSTGRNVNVLVLDTEVYSNTGGQASKATPLGASAKFAVSGKATGKKDLGMEAMSYGNVYVARIAFGSRPSQTVEAFLEAESYPGPSIIIAYSHCIAHGYDLQFGAEQQKLAVNSGVWPLYRYDPRRIDEGKPPLQLDSPEPKARVADYQKGEARFRVAEMVDPVRFKALQEASEKEAKQRFALYKQLAGITLPGEEKPS